MRRALHLANGWCVFGAMTRRRLGETLSLRTSRDEPTTIPNLKDTGQEMTDAEMARKTTSPGEGYPAGTTQPQAGLTGDEARVNADVTPTIADDAEHGQSATPTPDDEAGNTPSDS